MNAAQILHKMSVWLRTRKVVSLFFKIYKHKKIILKRSGIERKRIHTSGPRCVSRAERRLCKSHQTIQ